MNRITEKMITDIIQGMKQKHLSSAMISSVFQEIKRTFSIAVRENAVTENPCGNICCSRNRNLMESTYPVTFEDHQKLLSAFERIPLCNLFSFCYYTGISFTAARQLRIRDVDLQHRKCMIARGRNRGRIYLSDDVFCILNQEYQKHPSGCPENDFLFLDENGRNISRRSIRFNLSALRSVTGVSWLNLPDITRTNPYIRNFRSDR